MSVLLVILVVVPLAASAVSLVVPIVISQYLTVGAGAACFGLAIALVAGVPDGAIRATSYLRVDALSVVFMLAVTFLYAVTSVFVKGYLERGPDGVGDRYARRFYVGFNLFCWTLILVPAVDGLALLWIALEVTTVISALLVASDRSEGASEAAWKYVLLASLGLGIALLATILMYYAGTRAFGSSYDFSYPALLSGAARFRPDVVRISFVLAVLGYGTKVGLFPVHTWLPDAHSEAPTPVSALLSGALLVVSFYAILRYFQIAVRTLGPAFARDTLLIFGVLTLLLASLYVLSQRDMKRLLAYSSMEHMGILAIGMSFAAPVAVVGVLLQVLAHAAAKGTAFFGAGSVVRKYGTKDMTRIRNGVGVLPWSGPLFVVAVLALSALPPFGVFRSEFDIVEGGLRSSHDVVAAALIALVVLAFFGLTWFTTQSMIGHGSPGEGSGAAEAPALARGEVSWWIVAAMVAGLAALLVLGVHPPSGLSHLLDRAAAELRGRP